MRKGSGRVLTLKDIRDRSEEFGDCLLWKQAAKKDGACPSVQHAGHVRAARPLVFELHEGRAPRPGYVIVMHCMEKRCLERSHMLELTRKQMHDFYAARGIKPGPSIARSIARRARPDTKRSIEKAREVRRLRAEGLLYREIAERTGVPIHAASLIALNKLWREVPTNASVFSQHT